MGGSSKAGRADDLLDNDATGLAQFVVGGGCRNIDGLQILTGEFLKLQRPVVEGGRQAEAVIDQRLLA